MAAATNASTEETSIVACHDQPAPARRMPCGRAVPSVSMPTSCASAAPARSGTQLTTSFMPSG